MAARATALWTAHGPGAVVEWNLAGGYALRTFALEADGGGGGGLWVRALAAHGRTLLGGTAWGTSVPYAGGGGEAAVVQWELDVDSPGGAVGLLPARALPQPGDVWALAVEDGRVWAAAGREVVMWE